MRILVVDDEESVNFAISELFIQEGYDVIGVYSAEEGIIQLEQNQIDIAIVDYNLPGINGIDLLTIIKKSYSSIPVILITAYGSESVAIEAIKKGAYDYIAKPFENTMIRNRVNNIRESLTNKLKSSTSDFGYYFSPAMTSIINKIETVSKTDIPILITGESGTGKELIAKLAHHHSERKGKFISINCSAIPENLIESELFGAEKGSYTGSQGLKIGIFEQADNGTLFLDEIGEMPIGLQAKLLRVIQENEIMRIGSAKTIKINTRILAATNINIEDCIQNGTFREDLYYRLNVVKIEIPPLRQRKSEITHLAMSFINDFNAKYHKNIKGFDVDLLGDMNNYQWKGNIRELKNKVEHAVIMCNSEWVGYEHFVFEEPIDVQENSSNQVKNSNPLNNNEFDFLTIPEIYTEAKKQFSDIFDKNFILYHLNKNDWNVKNTADRIGLSRQDLYKKMKKVGIKKNVEYS